jgi:hypothetical protein
MQPNWEFTGVTKPSRTVYLISCVSRKLKTPARAQDLYVSSWFLKARDYVSKTGSPWFILSAEYGLVPPDRVIAPYERTLHAMRKPERQEWAGRVQALLDTMLPIVDRIIVLAGMRYREFLMGNLRRRVPTVEIPMEGLTIGRQLQFLSDAPHPVGRHDRF